MRFLSKLSGWPSGLRRQTQGYIDSLLASVSLKHSGPRMWAWVRIPPLTDFFPSLVITAFFSFTPGCLKMHYGIKKFLPLVFIFFLS